MIFRPPQPRTMWDSWLFEWQGKYHLFYLETQKDLWDHVGHATSIDLVHWTSEESFPTKGESGEWNHAPTLTGMVTRYLNKFYMFVGAEHSGIQQIGIYQSDDLYHWKADPRNPILSPKGPYYLMHPILPQCSTVDWRDPCITYCQEDQCYHAFLCARLPVIKHTHSGAVLAHVRSQDLIQWDYLPPVDAPTGKFSSTEVPDFFELNGRYYFLFSSSSLYGIHHNIPTRDDAVGTFYMVSDSMVGPYQLFENYLLVGAGQGNVVSYVGRTIPYQTGRLLYHHINSGPDLKVSRHTWGAPKRIIQMQDGSLALQYLPVLAKLETGIIHNPINNSDPLNTQDLGIWEKQEGEISGSAEKLGSACKVLSGISDLHLACQINSETALRAGVVLRSTNDAGVLITLNYEQQRLEIGTASYHPLSGWGTGLLALLAGQGCDLYKDINKIKLCHNQDYLLRCFARDEHFEVYLDDQWIFTSVLRNAAQLGDIELYVSGGQARFSNLRIALIEPLG